MKLTLVLQCISTWDFEAVSGPLSIRIDGRLYPCHTKTGGYYIFTRPLPMPFTLSIQSSSFFPYERRYASLPPDKVMPVQLTPRYPRGAVTWLEWENAPAPLRIALGYGYHRLASSLYAEDHTITIKNPLRKSLEGQSFMIRNTQSGEEEGITLAAAEDTALETYRIPPVYRSYPEAPSALLPVFTVMGAGKDSIPLNVPGGGPQIIWLYTPQAVRLEVVRGQRVQVPTDHLLTGFSKIN